MRSHTLVIATKLILSGAVLLTAQVGRVTAKDSLSFNRDIRPILSENCFACHGPDETKREADLRLDTRHGAIGDDGGPAAPDKSELIARVTSDDEDERMPPADSGKKLTADQIAKLRRWIVEGAPYEAHWSLVAPRKPDLPSVRDSAWPKNPIDHFVLARLESSGLAPSSEAARATLIRRLYLDLLGILPTPAEVEAFVKSSKPDAYGDLVDRLLANPHFGERWARHWLDQARYADSNGYAPDGARTMWPYRDWVINAFNNDLPFDQFTVDQLAGDLLEKPTPDSLVATGFHRNTLINTEGGTKADQFRVEQTQDRVDTTGGVWLALTVGCARCHTHKYDPIEQREYYQLYAFFDSLQDKNSVAPTIKAHSPVQKAQIALLQEKIATVRSTLEVRNAKRTEQRAQWEAKLAVDAPPQKPDWRVLKLDDNSSKHGATFDVLSDDSILVGGQNRPADRYALRGNAPIETIRSLRLELLRHESLPLGGPGRATNGNIVLSRLRLLGPDGKPRPFAGTWADHSQPKYGIAGAIDENPKSGWAINNSPEGGANQNRVAELVLAAPLGLKVGDPIVIEMEFYNGKLVYNLGHFRISVASTRSPRPAQNGTRPKLAEIVAIPAKQRSPKQQQQLDEAFTREDPTLGPLAAELKQLETELQAIVKAVPTAMVLRELSKPRKTHIHVRGDFLRPGDPVEADVPGALPSLHAAPREATPAPRATRLDLSRWLTRDDHPLTARVRVNRIWMRLFGRGLVETENDFGTQGSPPTHPELLDWLAVDFREQDWSTKQLIRLIVTSSTYRQSSRVRLDLQRTDPRNLLLGRQNRVRVEAEIVRDLALSAAGLLSPKIGGPSVFPPQPDGVYSFTQAKKSWKTSPGEDRYRRGMYTFFYRSAPHPLLSTFDVPKFNQTCTRRDRSNTPLQSLTMANDEALVEAAQALARRVLRESPATAAADSGRDAAPRIKQMFRVCLSRTPSKQELAALLKFFTAQRQHFAERETDAEKLAAGDLPSGGSRVDAAAWTATARVLLNLDEMITRE